MQRPYVDYLIARGDSPPRSGLIYDYLLAGDGVWLAAENAALRIRAPVARAAIRGLPPLGGMCELLHGRLPTSIWSACVAAARAAAIARREILFLVIHGPGGYRLVAPGDQIATATRVTYAPPVLAVGEAVALTLHSHHTMPAFFSATDDADEQDLGLYGVLGRLLGDGPEVLLRGGAYGHWLPVPWEAVFEGGRGAFRDVAFDPPRPGEPAACEDETSPALPTAWDAARPARRVRWPVQARLPWHGRAHPRVPREERA